MDNCVGQEIEEKKARERRIGVGGIGREKDAGEGRKGNGGGKDEKQE
jgi:hypothetical protein